MTIQTIALIQAILTITLVIDAILDYQGRKVSRTLLSVCRTTGRKRYLCYRNSGPSWIEIKTQDGRRVVTDTQVNAQVAQLKN